MSQGLSGDSVNPTTADDLSNVNAGSPTKGKLFAGDGSEWVSLAVGSDDQVLTADAAEATGLKWAAGGGGGSSTFAGVRVRHSTTQSHSNNAVLTPAFDTEDFDTNGFHDTVTNNERLTVPVGQAGFYHIGLTIEYDNQTGSNSHTAAIVHSVDGNIALWRQDWEGDGTFEAHVKIDTIYEMAEGEYVDIDLFQNTGGTKTVNAGHGTQFWMFRIGT